MYSCGKNAEIVGRFGDYSVSHVSHPGGVGHSQLAKLTEAHSMNLIFLSISRLKCALECGAVVSNGYLDIAVPY